MKRVVANGTTCKRLLRVRRASVVGTVGNINHRVEKKLCVFMEDAGRHCGRRAHRSQFRLEDANSTFRIQTYLVSLTVFASSREMLERCPRLPRCLPASSRKKRTSWHPYRNSIIVKQPVDTHNGGYAYVARISVRIRFAQTQIFD